MSTNLVRSLIAGSVSAAASLFIITAPAAHAAGDACAETIYDDGAGNSTGVAFEDCVDPGDDGAPFLVKVIHFDFDMPELVLAPLCDALDPVNLDVRAAQTSPDDWQWRFWIDGDTEWLCNDTIVTELTDLETGVSITQSISVNEIVTANNGGEDFVSTFATPCHYVTSVYITSESVLFAQSGEVLKDRFGCDQPEIKIPDDVIIPDLPEIPEVPETPETPDTPESQVPGGGLPQTGNDATTVMVGGALLVVGAGLGFTAMSMTRRRRHA